MKHNKMLMHMLYFSILLWAGHVVEGRKTLEHDEIKRQLKLLNKPAVKTIKTHYGDLFDCVDMHKQPAFDHPLMKNHTLKAKPSFVPTKDISQLDSDSDAKIAGIGLKHGGCPSGTVPIRRTRKSELIAGKRLFSNTRRPDLTISNYEDNTGHHLFELIMGLSGYEFYGTSASLNIWPLELERDYWTSIAAYVQTLPNSIEAGWMVNPSIFHDSRSRLYVASSSDIDNGRCFNMLCNGFVQVDAQIPIGIAFDRMSEHDGPQYEIRIKIAKDVNGGPWWLLLGDIPVGYWTQELIPRLSKYATQIAWGGTASSPPSATYAPPIGSGQFAEDNFREACYIRRLQSMDESGNFHDPNWDRLGVYRSHDYCYDIKEPGFNSPDDWRRHIYVGGPECRL